MRIAIVKLSALGDIIHAMVVLQFIKQFNQKISIDWFVEESYKKLLESHPDINEVHIVRLKQVKKRKSLFMIQSELSKVRKLDPYDMVIDLQGLIKSALISKLIPSIKTIGFDNKSSREGLASLFYNSKLNFSYSRNVIERNIALVGYALGFIINKKDIQAKNPFLFPRKNYLDISFSKTKKNILLIPGASHISKCYPTSKFAELTRLIDANFIVIWGNENEKKLAMEIKQLSPKVNISNKLKLESLVLLVSMVDLVIGPDTGPTHIAWGLNVPSITLFGSTPGYRNTYQGEINKVIESESSVNPLKINKRDFSIKNISVNEVFFVAKELIKQ